METDSFYNMGNENFTLDGYKCSIRRYPLDEDEEGIADACVTMDLELNGEIIPAETIQKVFAATLDGVVATIV